MSIIEKHKPVSELRDMLCAFYFIARLPYSLKLSVRKFIKCNKDNLVSVHPLFEFFELVVLSDPLS